MCFRTTTSKTTQILIELKGTVDVLDADYDEIAAVSKIIVRGNSEDLHTVFDLLEETYIHASGEGEISTRLFDYSDIARITVDINSPEFEQFGVVGDTFYANGLRERYADCRVFYVGKED